MPVKSVATDAEVKAMEATPEAHREYVWRRKAALWSDRNSWDGGARDIAKLFLPRSSRFNVAETNIGGSKHNNIYDNTGMKALKTLGAGMMSGMTSPARPWFKLKHQDDDLMKYEPVKVWCAQATRQILGVFANSNIYRALHQSYIELGAFGTHAGLILPDEETKLHATPLTWGEYALSVSPKGRVDTVYREVSMTAGAMVREFGLDKVSTPVQSAYRTGKLDARFTVIHAIEPRLDYDPWKLDKLNMPWRSVYFEQAVRTKGDVLRESGYRRFRALAPRWQVTGQDTYGESPCMEALGDAKQLQHEQFRKAQGIDYMTKPPVGLPTSARGQEVDFLPGGVSYFDVATGGVGQRQLFDTRLDLSHLLADIMDVRQRINGALYADLFLMISSMDSSGSPITATEVAERHEEKLLMLGPVLERLTDETCAPAVDMAFDQLLEMGLLPPPPPELDNQPLETELIGILAQAQRMVQVGTTDRFLSGVAAFAQFDNTAADKLNVDEGIEVYADSLGVDPRMLADDDVVKAKRAARAQQQQAAAQQAQAMDASVAAKNMGAVPTQGGASNLGVDAIGSFSGYQTPQAERIGQP